MGGAGDRHPWTLSVLAFALTPAARKRRCQLFTSDMKVRLETGEQDVFYYPDLPVSRDSEDRVRHARVMNASAYPTKSGNRAGRSHMQNGRSKAPVKRRPMLLAFRSC